MLRRVGAATELVGALVGASGLPEGAAALVEVADAEEREVPPHAVLRERALVRGEREVDVSRFGVKVARETPEVGWATLGPDVLDPRERGVESTTRVLDLGELPEEVVAAARSFRVEREPQRALGGVELTEGAADLSGETERVQTRDVAPLGIFADEAEDELAREAVLAQSVRGSRAGVERFQEGLEEVVASLAGRVVEGVVGADRGEERADGDLVVRGLDLGFEDAEAVEVLDGARVEAEGLVDPAVEATTERLEVAIVRARLSEPHRFGVVVVGERARAAAGGLEREGPFEHRDGLVRAVELAEGEGNGVDELEAMTEGVVVEIDEPRRMGGELVPGLPTEELAGVRRRGGRGVEMGHAAETSERCRV